MTANVYQAHGKNAPGGAAEIQTLRATIAFDGSASMGDAVPGPAHLLAGSLAACVLKNVERFSHMLPFSYRHAEVEVELTRQDSPPRIIRASYALEVETDEPRERCSLLHKNIRRFGTITNTLAAACALDASMQVRRSDGSTETIVDGSGAAGDEPT